MNFIKKLTEYSGSDFFNPWHDVDEVNDYGSGAPGIRRLNLMTFLSLRPRVDYIFMGEALGYQGGHFSGIAFTSERILLGYHDVPADKLLGQYRPLRCSDPVKCKGSSMVKKFGFAEPSATTVWGSVLAKGLDPFKVLTWNIFPFHPYRGADMLTNRPPTAEELEVGFDFFINNLYAHHPGAQIIAVGKKCADTLRKFNVNCMAVRHPSNGGAAEFRKWVMERL